MIKVLKPGIGNSIQDRGRFGNASFGVSTAGVMDIFSANLANSILNNDADDALLEITFGNCEFQFLAATIFCITGADLTAKLNNKYVTLNTKIKVNKDDVLSFGFPKKGIRAYVAVIGGFKTQKVLNSRSYFKNITSLVFLEKDQIIPFDENNDILKKSSSVKVNEEIFSLKILGCFPGPEFEWLNKSQKKRLISQEFSISVNNNRMGYQLKEPIKNNLPEMLTSAVIPGTVQLTPSGKLIVLMKDCQTTGGYPRVLQLSEKAISILAQKTTNQNILFSLM